MEFSQVKYFIIAAQTQNLTKAASILNITQSALSKSISNLESELGVMLFDRAGKKVTLNESGRKFLGHAITSVQELDTAVSAAQIRDERPMIHIGLFQYSKVFMKCLKAFSNQFPSVIIQIDHLDIVTINLDTNEYDMLLFPQSPIFKKYKARVIYLDPYLLAVHKSHPLANNKSVRLNDLSLYKFIFIKHGDDRYDLPYHLCTSLGANVMDDVFTNDYELQRWMISNNLGLGFVPRSGAESYEQDSEIMLLPVLEDGLAQEIMIGFKREKHISEIGKQFSEFVRNFFEI